MARGHTHVLGLDIGSWAIKVVELKRTGSGIELMGRPTVIPTPARTVEGGVVVDSAAVGQAIADAISAGEFKTRQTIASVGGDTSVLVRITEVPKMQGKELDEAIHWELERQTPFPLDDTYFDYKPIEPPDADPNAQNMEVFIAVAQEEMVDTHVNAMQSAKLVPVAIDVEPLAIARSLVDIAGMEFADQTVGVVHIGNSASLILIIRKGLLAFVRTVPTGGQRLSQEIRQSFMNDETLAEQVKKAFADLTGAEISAIPYEDDEEDDGGMFDEDGGDSVFEESSHVDDVGLGDELLGPEADATQLDMVAPDEAGVPPAPADAVAAGGPAVAQSNLTREEAAAQEVIYEAIATPLVDLATEVRRSLEFYRRQHRNEEVDRIFISGGTGGVPGLDEFVAAETGVQTEYANPFAHLITDEATQPADYLRDIGPAMAVAVGLAMRDMIE